MSRKIQNECVHRSALPHRFTFECECRIFVIAFAEEAEQGKHLNVGREAVDVHWKILWFARIGILCLQLCRLEYCITNMCLFYI